MTTYRAAVLRAPRCVDVVEMVAPELGSDDVMVRVRSANLCPTDVKKWQDDSLASFLSVRPLILGHEIAGEIAAVGGNVQSVAPGDRVAIDPVLRCGICWGCVHGRRDDCDDIMGIGAAVGAPERNAMLLAEYGIGGGFAELCKVPASAVIPIPDALSFAAASLVEPLADVMRGILAGGVLEGRRCAVFGLGPMGLLHVQALREMGAHVIGVDLREDRRDTAIAFGADEVCAPEAVERIDNAYIVAGGTGLVSASCVALDALNVHGSVVLFASGPKGVSLAFDPNRLHYMRQRIVGVVGFEARDAENAIALLLAGAIDVDALRTPSIALDGVQSAFESVGQPWVLKAGLDFPAAS